MRAMTVFCLLVAAFPAKALEFQDGTQMTVRMGVKVKDKEDRTFIYKGIDDFGHRFESTSTDPKSVMWLDRQTGNWVRGITEDRLVENTNVKFGFMAGGPGENWKLSYTRSYPDRGVQRSIERRGRCKASSVRDGIYKIACTDKRLGRRSARKRFIVVDATTGMWIRRKHVNQANGRTTGLWEVIQRPVVTEPRRD